MNQGFVKGTSENLPKVDLHMILCYVSTTDCFYGAEMQGVKMMRSMRQNYGDNAVGYVQLLREDSVCTVEAKVTPEHRVSNKKYPVQVSVDEKEEVVIKAECQGCAASSGGCKHAIAFLAWLYRRSEEPAPTSIACYWKKSNLTEVGKTIKYKKIKDIVVSSKDKNCDNMVAANGSNIDFLNLVLNNQHFIKETNSHLIKFYQPNEFKKVSLHSSSINYTGNKKCRKEFIQFCSEILNPEICDKVSSVTANQRHNKLWFELRYARITASAAYEAAQCHTPDGSLVEKIMSRNNIDTLAMKRGRELESEVLQKIKIHVKQRYNEKVENCGLLLKKEYPIIGASPDGITQTAVIEIKCPTKEKTVARYYNDGKITKKFKAQLQLQMFFANKNVGHFCVADPDFENTKKISIITETFDKPFTMAIIKRAMIFWEKTIFPCLFK